MKWIGIGLGVWLSAVAVLGSDLPEVRLHAGKEITLTDTAARTLYAGVLELLQTSNFNSRQAPASAWPNFHVAATQEDYRQAISGRYLLITFEEVKKIHTTGGEVTVKEIVLGLDRPGGANALFTIDDEGRILSHGKYSGPKWLEVGEHVKQIIAGSN